MVALNSPPPASTYYSSTSSNPSLAKWVIIFGYDPTHREHVIRYLQSCGDIVEHHQGQGNWMFVRFETNIQAADAVTLNGTLLDNKWMVGVQPLTHEVHTHGILYR